MFDPSHYREDDTGCTEAGCPFLRVHEALGDAHRQFHNAQQSYQDPEGFRSYAGACIQALRNVTFAIQAMKNSILEFDQWYEPWQRLMGDDRVMRWVVHSRNDYVKKGELSSRSVANVTVIDSYLDRESINLDVDPLLELGEIGRAVLECSQVPARDRARTVVRVERRWVSDRMPDREFLANLSYAFSVLSALVADAHRPRDSIRDTRRFPESALGCMRVEDEDRVVFLHAEDGEFEVVRQDVGFTKTSFAAAQERYGDLPEPGPKVDSDLREQARYFFRLARMIMEKDGYHDSLVLLVSDDGMSVAPVRARSQAEKYVLWRYVARQVEERGAKSVIHIAEAWVSEVSDSLLGGDSIHRGESLVLMAESYTGESVELSAVVLRTPDGVHLGATVEPESGVSYFLEPVRKAWHRMGLRDSG